MLPGATDALASAYQNKPTAAATTLKWTMRYCFRVETDDGVSSRSCGPGPAVGTCSTELKPATPDAHVARAAATAAAPVAVGGPLAAHSNAAAGAAGPSTAPLNSASLSECLSDDLGCLVLLCHRFVLGVSAAGPAWRPTPTSGSNNGSMAAGGSSSSSTAAGQGVSPEAAAKDQLAILNSCLKVLNRLAVSTGELCSPLMTHVSVCLLSVCGGRVLPAQCVVLCVLSAVTADCC
jgi:hypothetical protein